MGPPPTVVPLTSPWVDPHSVCTVSSLVSHSQQENESHTYGVDSIRNARIPSTVSDNTPGSSIHIFHSYEDILEAITTLDYLWDDMHHCSYLLLQDAFAPSTYSYQYTVEAKDLIPHGHVDWFQNPIPALGVFEKANMANISPTIKVDISVTPGVVENRLLGYTCSLLKVSAYKALFKEFCDIFA